MYIADEDTAWEADGRKDRQMDVFSLGWTDGMNESTRDWQSKTERLSDIEWIPHHPSTRRIERWVTSGI